MFVLHPDPFLLPAYRISPFQTMHLAQNAALETNDFASAYFDQRFGKNQWQYTLNGREAIRLALQNYNLQPTDLVTILTTSENFYISSCVTKTIEAFCQWNRTLSSATKLILVNHEFGYPHPEIEKLKASGLPIIEDCCTTFFSQDVQNKVGQYGDFSTYSFPKFFPIQIGGLIVANSGYSTSLTSQMSPIEKQYLEKVMSYHLMQSSDLLSQRKANFDYAHQAFQSLGFSLRFPKYDHVVPSALLLNNHQQILDLPLLKDYLAQHGIQSSVFYGEDAFFIPCHQNLCRADIDYFVEVITAFKQQTIHG